MSEVNSRSQQKRIAAMKGLPAPEFYGGPPVVEFWVDSPVSKKNLMRYGNGHVYKDKKVEACEEQIRIKAHNAMVEAGTQELMRGALEVHIQYFPIQRRALVTVSQMSKCFKRTSLKKDIQNLPDTILDSMQGIVYGNDRQIAKLVVEEAR